MATDFTSIRAIAYKHSGRGSTMLCLPKTRIENEKPVGTLSTFLTVGPCVDEGFLFRRGGNRPGAFWTQG
jgi:hypothetical protein